MRGRRGWCFDGNGWEPKCVRDGCALFLKKKNIETCAQYRGGREDCDTNYSLHYDCLQVSFQHQTNPELNPYYCVFPGCCKALSVFSLPAILIPCLRRACRRRLSRLGKPRLAYSHPWTVHLCSPPRDCLWQLLTWRCRS